MTAILGYTDLLQDPDCDKEHRDDYINTIKQNGKHLLQVINDILDLSKIEAGGCILERQVVPVCTLIQDVISTMRVPAKDKNISLHVEYMTPLPQSIETDPLRLRQILLNLIGNSIKFTSEGGVRVIVRSASGMIKDRLFSIEVIDTGIGMTIPQMDSLFEPFVQVDSSMTRRFGGTGLGLVISKRLANALGGDITIDSSPGKGSSFVLTIDPGSLANVKMIDDINETVSAPEKTDDSQILKHKFSGRLLLVEDGLDNQRLLKHILSNLGFDVQVAEDGQVACDAIECPTDKDNHFDIILMDMQMPVMDGYQATQHLRDIGCTTPIIALTAHAMPGDREKCIGIGCNDYVSKPVNRQHLANTIAKYINTQPPQTHPNLIQTTEKHLFQLSTLLDAVDNAINDDSIDSVRSAASRLEPELKANDHNTLLRKLIQLEENAWENVDLGTLKKTIEQLIEENIHQRSNEETEVES